MSTERECHKKGDGRPLLERMEREAVIWDPSPITDLLREAAKALSDAIRERDEAQECAAWWLKLGEDITGLHFKSPAELLPLAEQAWRDQTAYAEQIARAAEWAAGGACPCCGAWSREYNEGSGQHTPDCAIGQVLAKQPHQTGGGK